MGESAALHSSSGRAAVAGSAGLSPDLVAPQVDMRTKGAWIPELDGLRGLLALWVFIGHGLGMSGVASSDLPALLRPLRSGTLAVDVFVILSGFVIAGLIERERLPWRAFITRRWFRLFPAYALCMVLGAVTLEYAYSLGTASNLGELGKLYMLRVEQTRENFLVHVLAHATMLHGVIPNELVPFSTGAFVDAAWSISLEWQFYLVAPILFAQLRGRAWSWVGVALLALAGTVANGRLYSFDFAGFLPLKVHYFALGILSWFAYRRNASVRQPIVKAIAFSLFLFLFLRSETAIPLALWCLVLAVIVGRVEGGILRMVLTWRPLVFLGTVSYGFYLCHQPVQIWLRAMMLGTQSELSTIETMVWMLFYAGLIALILSTVLHVAVEKPGMRLGKRLSACLAANSVSKTSNEGGRH